jgi:hypothetical protein
MTNRTAYGGPLLERAGALSVREMLDGLPDAPHRVTKVRSHAATRPRIQPMRTLRLTCVAFWVDVRLARLNGRWLASADTPDGPSLGCGMTAREALRSALEPFHGMIDELLISRPT